MWVARMAGLAMALALGCAGQEREPRESPSQPARGNPSAPNDPRAEARAAGAGPGAGASPDPSSSPGEDDVGALGPTAPTGGGQTLDLQPGAYGGYGAGPRDLETPTPDGGGAPRNFRVGLPDEESRPRYDLSHVCGRLSACFDAVAARCRTEQCRARYRIDAPVPAGRCAETMSRGLEDAPRLLEHPVRPPAVCSVQ
jgi:hypothetical protein